MAKIEAEGTRIVEDSKVEAGIYKDHYIQHGPEWRLIPNMKRTKNVRIIVPKGTIIKEFKLN